MLVPTIATIALVITVALVAVAALAAVVAVVAARLTDRPHAGAAQQPAAPHRRQLVGSH